MIHRHIARLNVIDANFPVQVASSTVTRAPFNTNQIARLQFLTCSHIDLRQVPEIHIVVRAPYGMQDTFDELYQKSQNGEVFENLMDLIVSRDNILLAYRNIKANKGSYTAGTDKKNITDIGSRTPDDVVKRVRFIVTGSEHGYRPKPVRRKDIPKPNGKTRPLGIPCIWDRLIP